MGSYFSKTATEGKTANGQAGATNGYVSDTGSNASTAVNELGVAAPRMKIVSSSGSSTPGETKAASGSADGAPDAPNGSRLEVKRVDEVYDQLRGEWQTRDSVITEKPPEKDPYEEYAFVVNRKFTPTTEKQVTEITTTIDIHSQYLKKAGTDVIKQVQGISWTSNPLKVDPNTLLAFLPDFDEYLKGLREKTEPTEEETNIISHLSFLLDFLRQEYAKTLQEVNSLLEHDEITYDLLWAVLIPRSIIFTLCPFTSEPRCVRLMHCESVMPSMGTPHWRLDVEYVDWNASAFDNASSPTSAESNKTETASGKEKPTHHTYGYANMQNLQIPMFKGAAKIRSLPAYPIKFHQNPEQVKARLVERGRQWVTLQGVHHMHYSETAFRFKECKCAKCLVDIKLTTNSRIMIDWKLMAKQVPNYSFPLVLRTLEGAEIDLQQQSSQFHTPSASEDEPVRDELEEYELLLTSPVVYGFSLSDKAWLEFKVDFVVPFKWNDEAFENLVLPETQKSLVQTLVEAHSTGLADFDDFVQGKGRGLVINLFGNPGVGKSLTAEATSEHVRKPLYVVGAGELGTSAAALDLNLTRIFNISSNWGAVVLIDEADVFLEERSFHDLERNAMVAVFLRQLEYFRGILFLTTNRVRTFDEAFQSRIHVALHYHDLSSDAKRQIWVAFLKKVQKRAHADADPTLADHPTAGLTKIELQELGEKKVNGRQIKNVVRTATALASSMKESVGYKHLSKVLDMMDQFEARSNMYQ